MRGPQRAHSRAAALVPAGTNFFESAEMSLLEAENRFDKSSHQIPCHLGADCATAHAQDIHVVVLHALAGRKVIMNQACPNSPHLIRTNRGSHPAAANGDAALHFARCHCASQGKNIIRIIVPGSEAMRSEIHHLMTSSTQSPDEFLFQGESSVIRGNSDFHDSLMPDRKPNVNPAHARLGFCL